MGVAMAKRLFGLIGTFAVLSALTVLPVSADDGGYNPPPAVADNCNAGHGAFGAFSHHFLFQVPAGINWIAEAAQQGGIGDTTGPANSGLSQVCRTQ
jgi:hypothetical protein